MKFARHRCRTYWLAGLLVSLSCLLVVACQGGEGPAGNGQEGEVASGTPDQAAMAEQGEKLFNANCSVCHGLEAVGTNLGPPLVHRHYHPGHHTDDSFHSAVRLGVPQHHWAFGNMAPVPGLTPSDVDNIICYVRGLQRQAGIFEGNDFPTVC